MCFKDIVELVESRYCGIKIDRDNNYYIETCDSVYLPDICGFIKSDINGEELSFDLLSSLYFSNKIFLYS